jgi:putative salt-induced outer membrane protein
MRGVTSGGGAASALLTLLFAATSHAQVADGLSSQAPASEGKTDVATSGFEKAEKPAEEAADAKDATEFKLSAGAMMASGNSRLFALTGSSQLRIRREANQFVNALAANISRSASEPDESMQTTVENYQGKVRYDRFVGANLAPFLAVSARRDRFQGLDLRLNVDPGLAYYLIDEEKEQLTVELGYDLQYDVRRDENLEEAAADGQDLDKTDVRHSVRAFSGYQVTLNEAVTFSTGLEYLQGLPDTDYWRLNWDASVNSNLHGALSIATTFSLRYDNHPLPGIEKTDAVTALSLVYQLL